MRLSLIKFFGSDCVIFLALTLNIMYDLLSECNPRKFGELNKKEEKHKITSIIVDVWIHSRLKAITSNNNKHDLKSKCLLMIKSIKYN